MLLATSVGNGPNRSWVERKVTGDFTAHQHGSPRNVLELEVTNGRLSNECRPGETPLSFLGPFDRLVSMNLESNALEHLRDLPRLPCLRRLSLRSNSIKDLYGLLEILAVQTPLISDLDVSGNPCFATIPHTELEAKLTVLDALPSLTILNGDCAREGLPFWWMPISLWQRVASFNLSAADLAALGTTCRLARCLVKELVPVAPARASGAGGSPLPNSKQAAKPQTVQLRGWLKAPPRTITLTKKWIPGIIDVKPESAGENRPAVHLEISDVAGLHSLTELGAVLLNLKTASLVRCPQVRLVDALAALDLVRLVDCGAVRHLGALSAVRRVELVRCHGVELSSTSHISELVLEGFPMLQCASALSGKYIHHSSIQKNASLKDWRRPFLSLKDCPMLTNVDALASVLMLELIKCPAVASVSELCTVHTLLIDDCIKIHDITALKTCQSVTLRNMFSITDASAKLVDCHPGMILENNCANGVTLSTELANPIENTEDNMDGCVISNSLDAREELNVNITASKEAECCKLEMARNHQELERKQAISSYMELGVCAREAKEWNLAMSFFDKVNSLSEEVSGARADMYTNVGVLFGMQSKFSQELEAFYSAIPIYRAVYGEKHQTTAMAYNNLGIASKHNGDLSKALTFFQKAMSIYRSCHSDSGEIAKTQRNIDRTIIEIRKSR